eukprot:TRINITY_DN7195_c0_g1_i1.p1 TRINITY_DN7195_c0_g1~~TRINITY_DN7195_c0_g1_i1.p1  ORF type:complete len:214 (+),score=19.31 TRINITY_DN7195_c0_g1_i1:62-703(+)
MNVQPTIWAPQSAIQHFGALNGSDGYARLIPNQMGAQLGAPQVQVVQMGGCGTQLVQTIPSVVLAQPSPVMNAAGVQWMWVPQIAAPAAQQQQYAFISSAAPATCNQPIVTRPCNTIPEALTVRSISELAIAAGRPAVNSDDSSASSTTEVQQKPWMTPDLLEIIERKRQNYKNYAADPTNAELKKCHIISRKQAMKAVRKAKREFTKAGGKL